MGKRSCLFITVVLICSLLVTHLWKKIQTQYAANEVVSVCSVEETQTEYITFPYKIQGVDLDAETLTFYEGPFLEDGSQDEVYDVAALVLYNSGADVFEEISVIVHTTEDTFHFEGTWVLPGKICVLLEKNRAVYHNEPVVSCKAAGTVSSKSNLLNGILKTAEEDTRITLTNTSKRNLENLRIAYKNYLSQTDSYIGGITYKVGLEVLNSGSSYTLEVPYYVQGYSQIVFAYEAETDE